MKRSFNYQNKQNGNNFHFLIKVKKDDDYKNAVSLEERNEGCFQETTIYNN